MVVIPPGRFSMGSPDDELDRTAGEGPRHAVTIPYAFAVSRSEITFDQWDACVAAKACPPAKDSWGRGTMPAVDISGTAPRPMLPGCRSSPAKTTGCRARPSGNMRPAPALTRATPGETSPAPDMPIATAAAVLGFCKRRRWGRSSRTRSDCSTWRAMSGNGSKMSGTRVSKCPARWLGLDRGRRRDVPHHPWRFVAQRARAHPLGRALRTTSEGPVRHARTEGGQKHRPVARSSAAKQGP